MKRWQLKKKYLFVEALRYKKPGDDDYHIDRREPNEIPYAHVMDKSSTPPNDGPAPSPYLALNSGAGFITRFIVQGVDTDDILPQILVSEYGIPLAQARIEVQSVLTMLEKYLRARHYQRDYQLPAVVREGVHPTGQYGLDFSVNWFGTGGLLKGPL